MNDYEKIFRSVLDVRSVSGDELVCLCPFHGDSSPSLWANKSKGLWICYACGERGSTNSLLRKLGMTVPSVTPSSVLDQRLDSALAEMDALTLTGSSCSCWSKLSSIMPQEELGVSQSETVLVEGMRLRSAVPPDFSTGSAPGRCSSCSMPLVIKEKTLARNSCSSEYQSSYLNSRGISSSTADLFQLGWDPISQSVTIPYRTDFGLLLGVVHRRMKGKPKYHYPRKFPRTETMFGSWLLYRQISELPTIRRDVLPRGWVALCEGPFDVIKCWQAGVPAVGMWGSMLHDGHVQLLLKAGVQGVVVFTDRDSMGQQAQQKAIQKLSRAAILTRAVRYPKSYPSSLSDPGSLPETLLRARVARAHWRWPF
jgi:DNA primase